MARSRLVGNLALRHMYRTAKSTPLIGNQLRRLVDWLVPIESLSWVRINRGLAKGLWIEVRPRGDLRVIRGDDEPFIQSLISRWLEPGDTFFDVGANIGWHALGAARIVGAEGLVVAFEPDPRNFERLVRNKDRNGLTNLRPLRTAVGSRDGSASFERDSDLVRGTLGRVVGGRAESKRLLQVQLSSLDRWRHLRPKLVKVDVEGAEMEVLRGASRLLQDNSTYWIIELHSEVSEKEVRELLGKHGLDISVLSQSTSQAYGWVPTNKHLIAEPRPR